MTHGRIGRRENVALFTAALLAAIGGLIYELILGTAASYLLGDSVLSFSLATGITLFGMGIGSLLVNRIFRLDLRRELIEDQNIGLGVAFAGTALAIAIIIAATILS